MHACSFHCKDLSKNKKERKRRTMSAIGEDNALSRLAAVQEQSASPYPVGSLPVLHSASANNDMQACVPDHLPNNRCQSMLDLNFEAHHLQSPVPVSNPSL